MKKFSMGLSFALAVVSTACNASGGGNAVGGIGTGTSGGGNGTARIGESCAGGKDQICLALNFVTYADSGGKPVADEQTAMNDLRVVNDTYKQCGIAFQIESYAAVNPADYKLAYGAESANQLDQIRGQFDNGQSLLVVMTGPWGTVKNAWTKMPGTGEPYGAILEASVADYPLIMAHELGHYLNLDHVDDASNMMDAIIYPDSNVINRDQCDQMRAAATGAWSKMLR